MKKITNYKEFNEINSAPSLLGSLSETDYEVKDKILKYMRSFHKDVICPCRVYDYVRKMYTSITVAYYTDGKYIWDEREIYHFEHYNLKLEDEFVNMILEIS